MMVVTLATVNERWGRRGGCEGGWSTLAGTGPARKHRPGTPGREGEMEGRGRIRLE